MNWGIAIVRLSGELDVARKQELRDALRFEDSTRGILIDLSSVTYADSTALAELLRFSMQVQREGIRLAVLIRSPQLDLLIRYAGCEGAFKIFRSREEALAYLEDVS
jgi:anti-anti-sigma factor